MNSVVYHHTTTIALPWIVASGELRPSIFGVDFNHHIWATTNPEGDPTAMWSRGINRACLESWLETGAALHVRFVLATEGFVTWDEVKPTIPKKIRAAVLAYDDKEKQLYGEDCLKGWRLRREPIPLKSVLRVDVKGPGAGASSWRRIKIARKYCHDICDDPPTMAYEIDKIDFYSTIYENGAYLVPDRNELNEMYENSL